MILNLKHKLASLSSIDFIFVLCALIIVGYTLIFFSTRKVPVYIEMIPQNQEFSVTEPPPVYQETDAVNVGDAVYNSFGQKVAEVTDVSTTNYGGIQRFMKVIIKITAKYNPRTQIFSFNDSPLLIGNFLTLSMGKVSFKGKILNMYSDPKDKYKNYELKNVIGTILFRNIEPSQAEIMKNFEAKNSKGELIAKTLSAEITPQELDVQTDRGDVVHGYSTIYKDVTLRILMPHVPCSQGTCFFNDTVDLKVGIKYFWVHSNATALYNGIITNLEFPSNIPSATVMP